MRKQVTPTLLIISSIVAVLAVSTIILLSQSFLSIPKHRLSEAELSRHLGTHPNDKIEQWGACYKAYREYNWRVEHWTKIFRDLIKEKKLNVSDFEKIDFSLPGDPGYNDDPDNEFFNPNGKFKATPIPQEVIDDMTTVKNTRLVFNLRGTMGGGLDKVTGTLVIPPADVLVVIMPDVISKCPAEPNMSAWNENYTEKEKEIFIASDNKSVVEDEKSMGGMHFTVKKKGFYISSLAARTNWQKRENK